ncbi:MAG: hypothetical protein Kow009_04930 [Spirochaetales bacterium]
MNETFSNLLILIPLAFFLAIRILQSRAQHKGKVQPKPGMGAKGRIGKTVGILPAARRIEERRMLYPMAQEVALDDGRGEFISGTVSPLPEPPPSVPPRLVPSEESLPEEAMRTLPTGGSPQASLPQKVAKLPPWKQAMVLREILGPPKGW